MPIARIERLDVEPAFVGGLATFMVRLLAPWHGNTGKRLVKRAKLYVRDTGLLNTLLAIRSERDLPTHNKLGASWEGFAPEVAARACGKRPEELAFWSTHAGAEVDLFGRSTGRTGPSR